MVDRLVAVDDANYRLPTTVLSALSVDMGDTGTEVGSALNATIGVQVETRLRVYRPEEFGAVGDGVASDSSAFASMFTAMVSDGKTTGVVEFHPAATYLITDPVLISNPTRLTINGNGAVLSRTAGGVLLGNISDAGATGYGAGGDGLTVRDVTISGGFTVGVTCAFHHVDNIRFERVTWHGAIRNTHALDLAGCRDVEIAGCTFTGNTSTDTATAYSEAIQIDVSTYGASSLKTTEPVDTYDGLPTIRVNVHHCVFQSHTIGATTYPMPLPIGSHNFALTDARGWYDGIAFNDNVCNGWVMHVPVGVNYGWIHLHGAKNVQIMRNRFQYVAPGAITDTQTVINNRPVTRAVAEADAGAVSPTLVAATPRAARNWMIDGNVFEGFESATVSNALILFRARDVHNDLTTVSEESIFIRDNTIRTSGVAISMPAPASSGGTDRYAIRGNNVRSTGVGIGSNGVLTIAGQGVIEGNAIHSEVGTGFGLRIDNATVRVARNRVKGGQYGMNLLNVAESTITENIVRDAAQGIVAGNNSTSRADNNIITGNVVINCPEWSVRVNSASLGNVVYGNRGVSSPAAGTNNAAGNLLNITENTTV